MAFQNVVAKASSLQFERSDEKWQDISNEKRIAVVIGVVGLNKGRILLIADEPTALKITEGMNGEPLKDNLEKHLYLGEFTNIFSGKAITMINNTYKNRDLRLTPPVIFSGNDLDVTSPSIRSTAFTFSGQGKVHIDIGFEGMLEAWT